MKRIKVVLNVLGIALLILNFMQASALAEAVIIDWSPTPISDMPGGARYGMASAVIGDKI